MLKNISRARLMGAWFWAVAVLVAGCWAGGVAVSVSNTVLWSVACLVPPAVMLLVWRGGAPPAAVAELLYSVGRPVKEGRA